MAVQSEKPLYLSLDASGVATLVSVTASASSPGHALWERIDQLCKERGVTTTDLQRAAGVTWASAARWRKPPEDRGATPTGANLVAIAGAFGVTVEELLGIYDGNEPAGEAWAAFKQTAAYASLTDEERRRVAATPWGPGAYPTLTAWVAVAEAHRAARR